ncbi:MAG TPA: hypothetical protein VEH04_16990 [Verrucomicrobiae bacterium]|nr:hypothetical protein [Verrucomicrobiae bacterium]
MPTKSQSAPSVEEFPGYRPVSELFKRRFPSHKLNHENCLGGVMPVDTVILRRGTYFNRQGYVVRPGWKLRGWTAPPYQGSAETALVFEKETAAVPYGDHWTDRQEPGIYWTHASAGYLFFYL